MKMMLNKKNRTQTYSSSTTTNETSPQQTTNHKDLIVTVDSSSQSPNSSSFDKRLNHHQLMYPSSTLLSNDTHFQHHQNMFICDRLTHKKIKKNQQMFSCLLVQQYLFYFILLAFILLCSFGFYYVIVTTNLRIESLEIMLAHKLNNRIQMRFISTEDYFATHSDNSINTNNRPRQNNYFIYSTNLLKHVDLLESNYEEFVSETETNSLPKYYVLKQLNKSDFVLFPAYLNQQVVKSKKSLDQYCLSSRDYCLNLLTNRKESKKRNNISRLSSNKNEKKQNMFGSLKFLNESAPTFSFYMNSKVNDLNGDLHDLATVAMDEGVLKSTSMFKVTSSSSDTITTITTTTSTSSIGSISIADKQDHLVDLITIQSEKLKLRNNRHRSDNEPSSAIITSTTHFKSYHTQMIKSEKTCNLYNIESEPNYIVFMGVFHCTWMNNIGSQSNKKDYYYVTKSYKGSSVSQCSSSEELRSNRCYKSIQLKYPFYGTGHTIYKDYMFYTQDSSHHLISHSVVNKQTKSSEENDSDDAKQINIPDDAICCDSNDHLYSVKHSGYFDFEIDENGLWLIYKQKNDRINHQEKNDFDIYVIAKINEQKYRELKIDRKWHLKVKHNSIANMFISCGNLYALKSTHNSPASIYKLCDLLNDYDCSKSSANEIDSFNITISSRQLTSLSYNSDRKLLYMVDGGSFVSYNLQTVKNFNYFL